MDTSYLTQQVATIISQLHGLFDEIGVVAHDRESRESELFSALSETLHNQVRIVAAEKNELLEEAQRIITTIKQMESSLGESNPNHHQYAVEDADLKVTYPLSKCLPMLKEKHLQISRIHRERFEQVKKLVQALESYSSHLESSFVKISLPPTAPNASIPPTFDLSPSYVDALDAEFTRIYEEYTRRVGTVKALAENVIQLWAELGTPQAQTDAMIVKHHRESPEQLGLHEDDVNRLRTKRDKLAEEKKMRERRLKELKSTVEGLWDRLGVVEHERKQFLNSNRGCGVRQINEFEDELARLNELKRQNLHIFVEDARYKLQELWDGLYFSEEEMLDFTPAFSDVYSDALLSAHEQEIGRLEALKEQRAPTLALIDKHRSLVKDRNDLAASSQDASRLMMRGQKGEKRDPTRLLREEKMRKRIAKDLPKIAAELRKTLGTWEDEYGRPFLVHGERYLDELEEAEAKPAPGPRAKTPAGPPPSTKSVKSAPPSRSNSAVRGAPPSRAGAKTPVGPNGTLKRNVVPGSVATSTAGGRTPSRIPARAPLSSLQHGNNSPERRGAAAVAAAPAHQESRLDTSTMRGKMGPPARAPPPKMRDLFVPPPAPTPVTNYRSDSNLSNGIVRHVSPEDVYDDRNLPQQQLQQQQQQQQQQHHHQPQAHQQQQRYPNVFSSYHDHHRGSLREDNNTNRFAQSYPAAPAPPPQASRQTSNTSAGTAVTSSSSMTTNTTVSGSENWETYGDDDDDDDGDAVSEADATDAYYAKVRAARNKRRTPTGEDGDEDNNHNINNNNGNGHGYGNRGHGAYDHGYGAPQIGPNKRVRGLLPPYGQPMAGAAPGPVVVLADGETGQRIVSGSDANWTDEDVF